MKKTTLIILIAFITSSQFYAQSFKRAWGGVNENVARTIVAEVNHKTGDLYVYLRNGLYNQSSGSMGPSSNEIHVYSRSNPSPNLFFIFPPPKITYGSMGQIVDVSETSTIENFKIDSKNNLIITARTYKDKLATSGAYSSTMIKGTAKNSTIILKVSPTGKILWATYFHAIAGNKEHLTIDKDNNIYVLTERNKTDILSPSKFQNTGDASSSLISQNVISKLDPNGKHLWSTFYVKDQSDIAGIEAGTNGLYVYGNHFISTAQSNYFGTKNSYQEYASGVSIFNVNNSSSTVFLSKFNFDGTRAWSTYFGNQISKCVYNSETTNMKSLTVIGDDAYFITKHTNVATTVPSLSTSNVFLTTANSGIDPITLTKVKGNGTREWTTYLYAGETLSKSVMGDELHISAVIEKNNPNLSKLTNAKSYQSILSGSKDVYSYTMSLDGKNINYSSFYGYEGEDTGISLPTIDGYYALGIAKGYSVPTTLFATPTAPSDQLQYEPMNKNYWGNFIAYFSNKPLGINKNDLLQISIFPNPVNDVMNIQSKEALTEDTELIVFDMSGKKVLTTVAAATDLNQLNVSHLNTGIYLLQVKSLNYNQSFKFIKK